MQRAVRLMLLTVLLAFAYGEGAASASQSSPGGARSRTPGKVGFKVIGIAEGRKMAVWYPTADPESSFQYFRGVGSTLAPDGALASHRHLRLVIFSHGFGGCGTQSVFFTEELARRGYVVAAPDHKDALCGVDGTGSLRFIKTDEVFSRPERWNETTQSDRKNDLQLAIRWALTETEFGRQIDPNKIGLVGHSLGGYTALGLAGGWDSWQDDRVKAVLLFSPYAAPFLVQQRLPSIKAPVMYQAGVRDRLIPPSSLREDRGAYGASSPPKYYVELRDAGHFEWTNLLCFGKKTVAECLNTKPNARLINAYGIAFLDRYLKEQAETLQRLDGSGLESYKQISQ